MGGCINIGGGGGLWRRLERARIFLVRREVSERGRQDEKRRAEVSKINSTGYLRTKFVEFLWSITRHYLNLVWKFFKKKMNTTCLFLQVAGYPTHSFCFYYFYSLFEEVLIHFFLNSPIIFYTKIEGRKGTGWKLITQSIGIEKTINWLPLHFLDSVIRCLQIIVGCRHELIKLARRY